MGLDTLKVGGVVSAEVWRGDRLMDTFSSSNTVTDEGIDLIMQTFFKGHTEPQSWHLGLRSDGDQSAGDTLAAKAWTELTGYAETQRPQWEYGSVESGALSSNTEAMFTITAPLSIRGAFLAESASKNETNSALFMVNRFARIRILYPGDQLKLRYHLTLRRP